MRNLFPGKKTAVVFHIVCALAALTARTGHAQSVTSSPSNGMLITAGLAANGSSTVSLKMPGTAQSNTLKVILNGTDVSTRFQTLDCGASLCEAATLTTSDGLLVGKNVLYATAKNTDGRSISARQRFGADESATTAASASFTSATPRLHAMAGATNLRDAGSTFLPTTVSFNTNGSGGWVYGANAWFSVGSQQYPSQIPASCNSSSLYMVVVLDRHTLVEKTAAPENSSQCIANAGSLAAYLKTLTPNDLVVVGTTYGHNADTGLDTSSIGGSAWGTNNVSVYYPRGYMVIGAGGAAANSAYESFYSDSGNSPALPTFAFGMLQEDQNGNYSFQPSDAVEYIVSPNDTGYNNSIIRIGIPPRFQSGAYKYDVYTAPANNGVGGYWLLVLDRTTSQTKTACPTGPAPGHAITDALFNGCGTFYPTGSSNSSTASNAYLSLSSDLNKVGSWQLAVLTTVGIPAYGNMFAVAATNSNNNNPYYANFATTLESLNGTPHSTLFLGTAGSAYTLISSPGIGDSLSGATVLSSTSSTQQQQTGYVHGLISRNRNGLYMPSHTSQESQAIAAAGGAGDFTMGLVISQQPVVWPELSQTTILPANGNASAADSIAGQQAAYRWLSYNLVKYVYIQGATGTHLDDIHYYFTGGSNSYLDYHTYDPRNFTSWIKASNPLLQTDSLCSSSTATSCTWLDPVTSASMTFSVNDLSAVSQQLSTEIVDLTNVLQFMVSGSTNQKDVVASGNANLGLALVGAAATVQASTLQPDPKTVVSFNVSNILNLVGSAINVAATIGSDGIVPPDLTSKVDKAITIIGDIFQGAGSITGGLGSTTNTTALPSPNFVFTTTIGELANSNLQGQLGIGFDIMLDSILGDWGKLSAIGPLTTNTSNLGFYSQNQVAQNATIQQMNQAAQRSFYLSLLPSFYSVQYWPSVYGAASNNNAPDMGDNPERTTCNSFYLWPQAPAFSNTWYPSYSGAPQPFASDPVGGGPVINIDYYVVGGAVQDKSSTSARIQFIDTQLASTLFGASGLNLPFDPFVSRTGPMASVFVDMSTHDLTGFPNNQICSFNDYNDRNRATLGLLPPVATSTTTAFSGPASAVLGETLTLQASASSAAVPVPTGSMLFKDGAIALGTVPVDATGHAALNVSGLSLGAHSIVAYFLASTKYSASASPAAVLTIYANAPDLAISTSAANLQVTYGVTSSSVNLQITSLAGLAGTVSFACSGLPVGMTCKFNPAQVTLTATGTTTASLVVSSRTTQSAGLVSLKAILSLLLLPVTMMTLWRIRKGARNMQGILSLVPVSLASIGLLIGCASTPTKAFQETGSKTVLITATTGSITRSIPLNVSIQ
ncbi:hypothetical protein BH10ACI4_BH10ACI4_08190 [soil metagenome]